VVAQRATGEHLADPDAAPTGVRAALSRVISVMKAALYDRLRDAGVYGRHGEQRRLHDGQWHARADAQIQTGALGPRLLYAWCAITRADGWTTFPHDCSP